MHGELVDRLIACGFTRPNALCVYRMYEDDMNVLENYIRNAELLCSEEHKKEVTV